MSTGNILLGALCALACLAYVNPLHLTKEVDAAQELTPRQLFLEALVNLRNVDVRQGLLDSVLGASRQALSDLADLLGNNSSPQVSEVLDVLNAGLGVRLLVANEEYVQVDPNELERLLARDAVSLSRTLYPTDYFRQISVSSVLEQALKDIRPVITKLEIPLEQFKTVLSSGAQVISKRGVQERDVFSDLLGGVQLTLCQSVVSTLYGQLNATLTAYRNFLVNLTITSGEGYVVNIIATSIALVKDLAEEALVLVNEFAKSLAGSVCQDILSPSPDSPTSKAVDVGVLSMETSVATRGLLDDVLLFLRNLISPFMNGLLKSLVGEAVTVVEVQVDAFIQDVLAAYVYSLIDTVFP